MIVNAWHMHRRVMVLGLCVCLSNLKFRLIRYKNIVPMKVEQVDIIPQLDQMFTTVIKHLVCKDNPLVKVG